jgi:hypothetical protein
MCPALFLSALTPKTSPGLKLINQVPYRHVPHTVLHHFSPYARKRRIRYFQGFGAFFNLPWGLKLEAAPTLKQAL